MHVLYLTTELPYPAVSGGRVRTAADLALWEAGLGLSVHL